MGKSKMQSIPTSTAAFNEPEHLSINCKTTYNKCDNRIRNESINNNVSEADRIKQRLGIPLSMEILTNQVAGHVIDKQKEFSSISEIDLSVKFFAIDLILTGMLKCNNQVFKPLLKKDCADREIEFYEKLVQQIINEDKSLIELKQLIPKYYGVQKININGRDIDFLVLEDLTKDFKEPCIMDIKIGKRTWDPNATYSKIMAEEEKYRDCKRDLGFCIPGLQIYKVATNDFVKYGKDFGKSLNKDTAREVLKEFLNADTHANFNRQLLVQFLAALWQIQHFARNQRRIHLYSTSVLLIYDAKRLRQLSQPPLKRNNRKTVPVVQQRSLYRPLSLATLNNGCKHVLTGFSGQLAQDGPILKPSTMSSKLLNHAKSYLCRNHQNSWHKSIRTLTRTHSFQNNYDKDVESKKETYTHILDDLCNDDVKCEEWATVKLIDFAHVYRTKNNKEIDKNFLNGIENLVKIFEEFLLEADDN